MDTLTTYIDGIGVLGPGLAGWPATQAVLSGQASYVREKTMLPAPAALPAAERRRCGPNVKLSLAAGQEAAAAAALDVAALPTVFTASSGDGDNCHKICQALASDDRLISPTQFHNSVHNAPAGYWGIATGAMAPSSVLCAMDASFGAGLLEAMAQAAADQTPVLLIAYDTVYPEPLFKTRPVPDSLGVSLALAPQRGDRSVARIRVNFTSDGAHKLDNEALEALRAAIPSARCLPLLEAIARRHATTTVLDYLESVRLSVEIEPC